MDALEFPYLLSIGTFTRVDSFTYVLAKWRHAEIFPFTHFIYTQKHTEAQTASVRASVWVRACVAAPKNRRNVEDYQP